MKLLFLQCKECVTAIGPDLLTENVRQINIFMHEREKRLRHVLWRWKLHFLLSYTFLTSLCSQRWRHWVNELEGVRLSHWFLLGQKDQIRTEHRSVPSLRYNSEKHVLGYIFPAVRNISFNTFPWKDEITERIPARMLDHHVSIWTLHKCPLGIPTDTAFPQFRSEKGSKEQLLWATSMVTGIPWILQVHHIQPPITVTSLVILCECCTTHPRHHF